MSSEDVKAESLGCGAVYCDNEWRDDSSANIPSKDAVGCETILCTGLHASAGICGMPIPASNVLGSRCTLYDLQEPHVIASRSG